MRNPRVEAGLIAWAVLATSSAHAQISATPRDARGDFFMGGELWQHQGATNNAYGFQVGPDGHGGAVIRQEVHQGDQASFDAGTAKNRSEMCGTSEFALGYAMQWSFTFKVDTLAKPPASSWGAVIAQMHQLDQLGDYGNSPPFEIVLMAAGDGTTELGVGANYTLDPAKVDTYQWPLILKKFDTTKAHTVALTLVFDPVKGGGGRIKMTLDGALVLNWTGQMGVAGRTNYAKFGWYDGGDSQVRAIEHWGMSLQ